MKKRLALAILCLGFFAGIFSLVKSEANAKSDHYDRLRSRRSYTMEFADIYSRINISASSRIKQKFQSIKEKRGLLADTDQKTPEKIISEQNGQTPAPSQPAPTEPVQPAQENNQPPASPSPEYEFKSVMTSLFWVGEGSGPENGYISNAQSYWDGQWQQSYGGVDSPDNRCGYKPCSFEPKENPFYFALPYGERDPNGGLRSNAKDIPWYGDGQELLKNRWIEIKYNGKTSYAQWEDVGPNHTDDFNYVFGDSQPKNTFGVAAGLDVSPAVWDYLEMPTNSVTSWRFISAQDVPPGPWKETVTTK